MPYNNPLGLQGFYIGYVFFFLYMYLFVGEEGAHMS